MYVGEDEVGVVYGSVGGSMGFCEGIEMLNLCGIQLGLDDKETVVGEHASEESSE